MIRTLGLYCALLLAAMLVIPSRALAGAPQEMSAQVGATVVVVYWSCPLDKQSGRRFCPQMFYIYRSPSSGDFPLLHAPATQAGDPDPGDSQQSWADYKTKPSTKYTYTICDGQMSADHSNCASTSATTAAASVPNAPSGSNGGGSSGSDQYTPTPPLGLRALSPSADSISLAWENPPGVSKQVEITSGGKLLATLAAGSTRWVATGLAPHTPYVFSVCEGPYIQMFSCDGTGTTTWGSDPVLQAQRGSGDTVTLTVALDSTNYVDGLKITRQSSSDVCRQPVTLANGSQGCMMGSVGPTGVLEKGDSQEVIIANIPNGFNPVTTDPSAPPGPAYYYQACVTWSGLGVFQCSEVASVGGSHFAVLPRYKSSLALATAQAKAASQKAPVGPHAPARIVARAKAAPAAANTAFSRPAIEARISPNDAAKLFALGQASYAAGQQDVGVAEMHQALLLAQNHKQLALAKRIANVLAKAHTKKRN